MFALFRLLNWFFAARALLRGPWALVFFLLRFIARRYAWRIFRAR